MRQEMKGDNMQERILDKRDVSEVTGVSTVTLWRMEKAGQFPRRRQITPGRVGWLQSEVLQWIESRRPIEQYQAS